MGLLRVVSRLHGWQARVLVSVPPVLYLYVGTAAAKEGSAYSRYLSYHTPGNDWCVAVVLGLENRFIALGRTPPPFPSRSGVISWRIR